MELKTELTAAQNKAEDSEWEVYDLMSSNVMVPEKEAKIKMLSEKVRGSPFRI